MGALRARRYQSAAVARASLARFFILVATAVAAVLVLGIVLVLLKADRSNDIVQAVRDAARFLAGPFNGLFTLDSATRPRGAQLGDRRGRLVRGRPPDRGAASPAVNCGGGALRGRRPTSVRSSNARWCGASCRTRASCPTTSCRSSVTTNASQETTSSRRSNATASTASCPRTSCRSSATNASQETTSSGGRTRCRRPRRARGLRGGRARGRRAPARAAVGAALGRRDLLGRDRLGQLRQQLLQEGRHALLLLAELPRQLLGLLVADRLGQRLDRDVVADLLVLVPERGLRVLEQLLGLPVPRSACTGALRRATAFVAAAVALLATSDATSGPGRLTASAFPPSFLMRRSRPLACALVSLR